MLERLKSWLKVKQIKTTAQTSWEFPFEGGTVAIVKLKRQRREKRDRQSQ